MARAYKSLETANERRSEPAKADECIKASGRSLRVAVIVGCGAFWGLISYLILS